MSKTTLPLRTYISHLKRYAHNHKHAISQTRIFIGILFIVIFIYIAYVPKATLGAFFFDGQKPTYSLPLASFFYKQSLYFDTTNGIPPSYTYYQLSRIAFIKGDLTNALVYINKELEFHPENTQSYYMKGLTLGYLGRVLEAIQSFQLYIKADPYSWAAHNDMAWLQFRSGDYRGALTTINAIYSYYIGNPWVENTRGVMLMNLGNNKEAEQSFIRGLASVEKMMPHDWGAAYPGNHPDIYSTGLSSMRKTLENNLALVRTATSTR